MNTDALLAHQIIAEPANKWVRWGDETPLDVTAAQTITPIECTDPRPE